MDWTIKVTDIAIVFATLLSPFFAVQAQKWVEQNREIAKRRITIFRKLMATRGSILSPAHVEALNVVPIEFYGKKSSLVAVVNAWKAYIDHLYKNIVDERAWGEKRVELLNNMLVEMSTALGYNFNSVEISRELYSPKGHAAIETDQEIIRRGLVALLRGEIALPMDVRSFPSDAAFVESQKKLQEQLLLWLAGERRVKVDVGEDSPPPNSQLK